MVRVCLLLAAVAMAPTAHALFKGAHAHQPDPDHIAYGISALEDDMNRASYHFKMAIKKDPTRFDGWYNLGQSLMSPEHAQYGAEGALNTAHMCFKAAMEVEPTNEHAAKAKAARHLAKMQLGGLRLKWQETEHEISEKVSPSPRSIAPLTRLRRAAGPPDGRRLAVPPAHPLRPVHSPMLLSFRSSTGGSWW
jgi:hypothetical protein